MGSQSDYSIMKESEKILKTLKIKYQTSIVSAHRTPKRMFDFAEKAEKNGFGVIVAGAGGAGSHAAASEILSAMATLISVHSSYTLTAPTTIAHVSAIEDVIDDFLGGSHSEALDVLNEAFLNGTSPNGSASSDLAADVAAREMQRELGRSHQ